VTITRKGKPVVIILPIEEYKNLISQKKKGLLLAKGSLAGMDKEIDDITDSIYENRKKEMPRKVSL